MRGAIIHGPKDVRFEDRPDPAIVNPTDAAVPTVAPCVRGRDLWRYPGRPGPRPAPARACGAGLGRSRGTADVPQPTPIGHEYVGVVEAVGADVATVKP